MAAPERRSGLRSVGDFHPAAPAPPAQEAAAAEAPAATGPPIVAVPTAPEAPAHLTPVTEPEHATAGAPVSAEGVAAGPSADEPTDPTKEPVQMLSARMPTSLHKRVRVHAVTRDESVQDFVTRAVTKLLDEEGG